MIPKVIYKSDRSAKLEDFERIANEAKDRGLIPVVDNNRDGIMRFAKYDKSFLSRKINNAGCVEVFLITPDIVPLEEKVKDNIQFSS